MSEDVVISYNKIEKSKIENKKGFVVTFVGRNVDFNNIVTKVDKVKVRRFTNMIWKAYKKIEKVVSLVYINKEKGFV